MPSPFPLKREGNAKAILNSSPKKDIFLQPPALAEENFPGIHLAYKEFQ